MKQLALSTTSIVRPHILMLLKEVVLSGIYSLVPGVSFDLFDSLYKPDAPKTTTVHVSDTRTDMLHCTATRWGLWLKHLAPGYKPIITPHYRALAVYVHSMGCYN